MNPTARAAPPDKLPISLTINGEARELQVAPWTTLLDLLREHLRPDRHQEGLRPWPVRRLHRARGRRARELVLAARGDEGGRLEVQTIEGLAERRGALHPDAGRVRRARRLPVRLLHAGPDLSAVGLLHEGHARSADGDTRADERQHLPLRRLSQHRRRDRAGPAGAGPGEPGEGRRMTPFAYSRADRRRRRASASTPAARPGAVHRRRHEPARPDEIRRRAPDAADRHHPPARLGDIEEIEGGGLRLGALATNSQVAYDARVRAALSAAVERDPRRRLAPAPQRGDHRRQPAAAHPLLLFLRHGHALQQARARHRLPGHRRHQPHPRHPRHQRAVHRHATRPTCAWPWPRSRRPCASRARTASRPIPFAEFHRLPGDTPQRDTTLRPDEMILSVDLPAEDFGAALHLPEAARPRLLRLRARLGRGRAGDGGRHDQAGAPRARRRRAQALARHGGRGPAPRQAARHRRLRGRGRPRPARAPRATAHNAFKIALARRAIVRALSQAAAGTPQSQSDKRIR